MEKKESIVQESETRKPTDAPAEKELDPRKVKAVPAPESEDIPAQAASETPDGGKETPPEAGALNIAKLPDKLAYKPGEEIDFSGLVIECEGCDVTEHAELSVKPGTKWGSADKVLEVHVAYTRDGAPYGATFNLKRKKRLAPIITAIIALLVIAAIAAGAWWYVQPKGDTGSYIIPQGTMTDEEAQALVDDQAEKSRITVSIRPTQELKPDGALHVNFVVVEGNNGFSERLEVAQDGNVVYKSGIVKPGNMIEWGASRDAHAGPATATVYAVDDAGNDSGNPVSVEVEIVDAQ